MSDIQTFAGRLAQLPSITLDEMCAQIKLRCELAGSLIAGAQLSDQAYKDLRCARLVLELTLEKQG